MLLGSTIWLFLFVVGGVVVSVVGSGGVGVGDVGGGVGGGDVGSYVGGDVGGRVVGGDLVVVVGSAVGVSHRRQLFLNQSGVSDPSPLCCPTGFAQQQQQQQR